MTNVTSTAAATHTVVVERELPHPPQKIWRALTESSLLQQWLMPNDFQPFAGHAFQFRMDPMPGWNGIIDCKVLSVEAPHRLSYTWSSMGLDTVVTFTLQPTSTGTHLRMEQSGFASDKDANYRGATYGWDSFLTRLESVLDSLV